MSISAIDFLVGLNREAKRIKASGYPATNRPNTWLRDFDPPEYRVHVHKADEIIFRGGALVCNKSSLKYVWEECFRSALKNAKTRNGSNSIQNNQQRLELLYIFSSVLSSIALTAQIEKDAIREFVSGMFQEESPHSPDSESVYGLEHNKGSYQQIFYRKALRISVSSFGSIETLTPLVTQVLPSHCHSDFFNPVAELDALLDKIDVATGFSSVSDFLAFGSLSISWSYSQVLKLREASDEDFTEVTLLETDPDEDIDD
ncbi:MAG TPA: hypothetical protein PKA63_02950 [Oligoflexia bacterium]|nr:hypothetical protein [Oligoflexia bacterium]HMP47612.1 hypothetical protein [Oligoflexia bacterium]